MVRIRVVDFEDEEGQSFYDWLERKCRGRMVWNGVPRMISLFFPRYSSRFPLGRLYLAYQEANGPFVEQEYVVLSQRVSQYGNGVKYVFARFDVWQGMMQASGRHLAVVA